MPRDDFSDLPRYVQDYTEEQQERVVRFYAGLGLRDLRRRQDINRQQTELAYQQRNERVVESLQANADLLSEAVDRREFGDWGGAKRAGRRSAGRE